MITLVCAPLQHWIVSEDKTNEFVLSCFLLLVCLRLGIVLLHLSNLLNPRSFRYLLPKPDRTLRYN
jgi:hypothetical protein